ncbi:MAG: diguanylate cyclase, partial [Actinomycetota bacterium]|nr:diguanylate cyclase [Actinomycetota bacterium]
MAEPRHSTRERHDLVQRWLQVVAETAYVSKSPTEIASCLSGLVDILNAGLAKEPVDPAYGGEVGGRMVASGLIGADTLARSLDVLTGLRGPSRHVVAMIAAVSSGYSEALRERTLAQQENMKLALWTAKQRVDRDLRTSENRFREVFASSAIGIAITDMDGRFVETNPALAAILARSSAELVGHSLLEYISPDDQPLVPLGPGSERRRLVRHDGETAWVYLTMSVLHDASGVPIYQAVMIQDLSELQLLQEQLGHQLLYDGLTGVANRVHFESRLEAMLGQVTPRRPLMLCCLDIDAFSLINTAHGHEAGDRMLRTVATRLKTVVGDEDALVARVGGDEFAIALHGSPDPTRLVGMITAELAEPDYPLGLACSATMGIVRAADKRMSSKELFRAAESALRQAKATGRGQWSEYDSRADDRTRRTGRAATALPAAWENGDIDIAYRPIARLRDHATIRVRATARCSGEDVSDMAEATGLSVALGPWMLARSAEQAPIWQSLFTSIAGPTAPVVQVLLTSLQSADADLSLSVNRAVDAASVSPCLLEVVLDTSAVLGARGDAQDNLRTLGDIGVVTGLHGFTGGPREIALVERFQVRTVILADPFEGWRPDWLPPDAVPVRATDNLITSLRAVGASVSVVGVRDALEARW